MFYFYLYYVIFFAATLQNNFKQFALKMQYPPSPPPPLTSITVLHCEIFCHSVHCKTYTADGVFLTVVTAVPSLRCPPPVITAFRVQYYVLYGINMFVSLCFVETQNVCREAVIHHHLSVERLNLISQPSCHP